MSKMVWIDETHVKGEMSDTEFKANVDAEAERRKSDIKHYGKDGYFYVYDEVTTYKGIPYSVKIVRYFITGIPLKEIHGMNHIGKWAVLTCVPETEKLCDLIRMLPHPIISGEWMWKDTLHTHNDKQTLKQMVDEMHQGARSDIDELDTLVKRLEDYTKEISDNIQKIIKLKMMKND